jgi:hypothetical protein
MISVNSLLDFKCRWNELFHHGSVTQGCLDCDYVIEQSFIYVVVLLLLYSDLTAFWHPRAPINSIAHE